jgi:TolB protein
MIRYWGFIALGAAAALTVSAPAYASDPLGGHRIAYVRAGSVYALSGATETRLTHDSDDSRPRWSPDGKRIAYGHAGRLWVMNADGTGRTALTTAGASGAAWSPDGTKLAYAARGCTGIDGIFTVPAGGGTPQALFPAGCRGKAAPAGTPASRASGDLAARLRADSAVAWSPDATRIAFRGGDCLGVYDDCLTVGTVATGGEDLVDGYGGGGQLFSGFAVVPAWSPDGRHLSYTTEQQGADRATTLPIHVVEVDLAASTGRTVGVAMDREMAYAGSGVGILTGQVRGASWVVAVNLATGTRTPLKPGSQPNAT